MEMEIENPISLKLSNVIYGRNCVFYVYKDRNKLKITIVLIIQYKLKFDEPFKFNTKQWSEITIYCIISVLRQWYHSIIALYRNIKMLCN